MNKQNNIHTFRIRDNVNIIIYPRPDAYSAAVNFWLLSGGVNETRQEAGISHVLEHMMFKSCEGMTAAQISHEFTRLAAHYNASTDWDMTNYRATVPASNLEAIIRLYARLLNTPLFKESELETEKGAILQELNMYKNKYDVLSMDCATQGLYGNPDNKRNRFNDFLIGTEKSVKSITSAQLHKRHSRRAPLTIAVAGQVGNIDAVVRLLVECFKDWDAPKKKMSTIATGWDVTKITNRDIDQAHIAEVRDLPDIKWGSREHIVLRVLGTIYGASDSSRLYTEIREKRGLAYCAWGGESDYAFSIHQRTYVATEKDKAWEVLKIVHDIQDDLMNKKVSASELRRVKNTMIGSMFIGFDNPGTVALCAGSQYLVAGTILEPNEYSRVCESVTAEEVREMARKVFTCNGNCTSVVEPERV